MDALTARAHVFQPWATQEKEDPVPVIDRGEGCYFWDAEGRRYLDLLAQIFNVNLGYGNPRVIEAIQRQAGRLSALNPTLTSEPRIRLGELLSEVTPGDLGKAFLTNSGSEANEIAFQMARMVTGRQKILARYRSYHGTTIGTFSVGGDPRRLRSEPGVPGTVRFFDPYCYRCDYGLTFPACDLHCMRKVEQIVHYEGPENIAAVVVEPVTGANGCIVPPEGYLRGLRDICDRYGILLIADEVIDGFGRTGKWFAVDHWGVVPDILVVAKGITSGYVPLGAAIVRPHIADYFERRYLPLGCTYTGHPLACAAAVAAISEYRDRDLPARAAQMGRYLMAGLRTLQEGHPLVGDARGLGLLACLELVKDRATREPLVPWNSADPISARIKRRLLDRGLFAYVRWNMIFLSPPLIITEAEIDEGLGIIDEVLGEVEAGKI